MFYQIIINNVLFPYNVTINKNEIIFTLKNPLLYEKGSWLDVKVIVWENNCSYNYKLGTYANVRNNKFVKYNNFLKFTLSYNRQIIRDCNILKKDTCISDCTIKLTI